MAEKPVKEILAGHLIPFPVRRLEMAKEHRGIRVAMRVITPHVDLSFRAALGCPSSALKPGMEGAGVIHHQIHHHLEALRVSSSEKTMKRCQISQIRMNRLEVGDVVAAVIER